MEQKTVTEEAKVAVIVTVTPAQQRKQKKVTLDVTVELAAAEITMMAAGAVAEATVGGDSLASNGRSTTKSEDQQNKGTKTRKRK